MAQIRGRAGEELHPVPLLSIKGTGEFITDDDDVKIFQKLLVSNLITTDISKSIALI